MHTSKLTGSICVFLVMLGYKWSISHEGRETLTLICPPSLSAFLPVSLLVSLLCRFRPERRARPAAKASASTSPCRHGSTFTHAYSHKQSVRNHANLFAFFTTLFTTIYVPMTFSCTYTHILAIYTLCLSLSALTDSPHTLGMPCFRCRHVWATFTRSPSTQT